MTVFVLWLRTADAEWRSSQCAAGQRVGVGWSLSGKGQNGDRVELQLQALAFLHASHGLSVAPLFPSPAFRSSLSLAYSSLCPCLGP